MTRNDISIYSLVIERLEDAKRNPRSGIIKFPHAFSKICSSFQVNKNIAWRLIWNLERMKKIKVVAHKGIILKKRR